MKELIEVFSALFETPVIIAGGAVRDHLLGREPKDYDLFVMGQTWEKWETYQTKLKEKLLDFPIIESKVTWHKSEPFLIQTISYQGKEIQILATPHKTAEELVATFDWGCCCFAFDNSRPNAKKYIYDKADLESIKPGEYLRLNKITFPFSTLRRGYRFSERYLMRLKQEDLQNLAERILKKLKEDATKK